MELMELQQDFTPDREAQERGVRLILEEPSRGRIFVLRSDDRIIGMANLLFTISIAGGGLVILMEDLVGHPDHRGQGYGSLLLEPVLPSLKLRISGGSPSSPIKCARRRRNSSRDPNSNSPT